MIKFSNRGMLIEEASELPAFPSRVREVFVDLETSSGDPTIKSLDPWDVEHCRVIGAAVTWDDWPHAVFVPRRLLLETTWLRDLLAVSEELVNQNPKYDVHVLANDLELVWDGPVTDTVSLAKIYDADRYYKGGYGLDVLSLQLLGHDISEYERRLQPYLPKTGPMRLRNKDYGAIPIDTLAEYGCEDILTARRLCRWLDEHIPSTSSWVVKNERALTPAMIAMERRGMMTDPLLVKIQKFRDMTRMQQAAELLKQRLGIQMNPSSPDDCEDVLINRIGFPPIYKERKNSDESTISFDHDVLSQYLALFGGLEAYHDVVQAILDYRQSQQNCSLFWDAWLARGDNLGILHPDYNANVRSGRMSCKSPNAQQLHKLAKTLILARPGRKLLCWDYSQLEYRWMVHYLQNPAGIKAYNENPLTDYHQWVADELCGGIKRRAAKTLNFTIGFGGGKARVIRMLSLDKSIIEMTGGDEHEIRRIATSVYYTYHRNLPELKQHSKMAENAARQRGYVETLYGRRLHLPERFTYKGFNRVVQGTAADNAKEGVVTTSPFHNALLRALDCHLIAQVHDEFLYDVPDDPEVIEQASTEITRCLEAPSSRCRVPILATRGPLAADNWYDAKGD